MTAGTILRALETYLQPLVAAVKGDVSVAETEWDAMEQLVQAPERFRVVLSWQREKAAEESGRSGIVAGTLAAYVQAPKNLEINPKKSIHREGTGGSMPFLDRAHWVIRMLRAVAFDHDQVDCQENLNYRGLEWLKFEETLAWRTIRAEFDITFAHDDPADESGIDPLTLYGAITFTIEGAYLLITKNGVTRKVRLLEV
jgi:hypothetical protein